MEQEVKASPIADQLLSVQEAGHAGTKPAPGKLQSGSDSSQGPSAEPMDGSYSGSNFYENPYLRPVLDLQMSLLPATIPHEGHVPYVPLV